jgi:hypothetical protein
MVDLLGWYAGLALVLLVVAFAILLAESVLDAFGGIDRG